MEWIIKVYFVNDYEANFTVDEQEELEDSQYRFVLAIEQIYKETGVMPIIGDWVEPLYKEEYPLDIAKISGRDFHTKIKTIIFEIE